MSALLRHFDGTPEFKKYIIDTEGSLDEQKITTTFGVDLLFQSPHLESQKLALEYYRHFLPPEEYDQKLQEFENRGNPPDDENHLTDEEDPLSPKPYNRPDSPV